MNSKDPMVEVLETDYSKLLQRLKCDFPKGIHAFSFIETLIKWKQKDSSLDIHILAPMGNFRAGVFFYITYNDRLDGSFYGWTNEGLDQLKSAMELSKLVEWDKYKLLFTCMPEEVWKSISEVMQPIWERTGTKMIDHVDSVYWLPWTEAKEMQVDFPDAMYIADLIPTKHAKTIDDNWPHKFRGSVEMIKRNIKLNYGLGLFTRGDGSLVSWAVHWFYGGIGAVQTLEEFKRQGCAAAVVKALTRRLGNDGIDVHLNVVGGNNKGNALFMKLGFRHAFRSVWAWGDNYDH